MAKNSYHTLFTHFKQTKIQKYAHEMHARLENAPNAADDNLPGNAQNTCQGPGMYDCTCSRAHMSKIPK